MSSDQRPPRIAGAPWLTAPSTQRVLAALRAGGFEARCVGGVVRNALMKLPVTDIDIATTARPDDVTRLARAAGLAVVETGLQHGTVTVIANHHPFEVTTLRHDVATHGRHATVAFTDDWEADARRRDFTMNALYCDADGTVYDPIGGYPDLLARRVRFIGDAAQRIEEDFLRILRFFRFNAQYSDGPPDPDGLIACTRLRDGLARLSKERIHQETTKLLVARDACAALEAMQGHGILAAVLPAAPRPGLLARLIEIEIGSGLTPDPMLRLAALAVEVREDAVRLARSLKTSREERAVLELAAAPASYLVGAPEPRRARALLYRRGTADYRRLLALAWARNLIAPVCDAAWSEALALPARWLPPRLPIDGADVLAIGVPAGPEIGARLRAVEDWWIALDFAPDRDQALAALKNPSPRSEGAA